ncbi:MAG: carboxymuconolactone decarboxylase family protein [Betaproteobacteria bacterium]
MQPTAPIDGPRAIPRIAPAPAPLSADLARRMQRLLPAGMAIPQIFLTVARNEGLFLHLVDTGLIGPTGLLDRKALPPALRELVILRTCVAAGCEYEFNLHVQTISARMGLSADQIDAIRRPAPGMGLWDARECAAMRLTDALVARLEVTDAEFAAAREHFDEAMLIEITFLVGMYATVAMLAALARPRWDDYRVREDDAPG